MIWNIGRACVYNRFRRFAENARESDFVVNKDETQLRTYSELSTLVHGRSGIVGVVGLFLIGESWSASVGRGKLSQRLT